MIGKKVRVIFKKDLIPPSFNAIADLLDGIMVNPSLPDFMVGKGVEIKLLGSDKRMFIPLENILCFGELEEKL